MTKRAPHDAKAGTVARSPGGIAHETGELHRLLVETVQDYAIFALDPKGFILSWNAGAQRFKGYTRDEALGLHFSVFYPRELVAEGFPDYELRTAAKAGRFENEGWRIRKDGTRFWANVVITALRNPLGELIGFAKVTRDLTERRAAEARASEDARRVIAEEAARRAAEERALELRDLAEKLRRQAVELEARSSDAADAQRRADDANRAKSQFLAAMSHELRTPLNAIGGYSDLLAMGVFGEVSPLQVEQLGRIKRSQEHLLGIITDILNFSRVEAGQLSYAIGSVPIHDVIDAVLQMLAPQALAKDVCLEKLECPADLAASADRAKVEQILLNLLSNAVKFTERGGRVSVSCEARDAGHLALLVRDSGNGIPRDQLQAIFEPFVQLGRSLTSTGQGTGLGLAISRDLARAMGGDITAESDVDVGSTFTLTLPRESQ